MDVGWCAIICPSPSLKWSLTLFLFRRMDITDLSGFLCLSNHPLIYHSVFLSLSLTTLLCILDETTKLRLRPSISYPAIMDLITQSLSSRSFILLLFSRSLPKACNYRVQCKTWGWASICLSLITHSSHTHTQTHTFSSSVWWIHAETHRK